MVPSNSDLSIGIRRKHVRALHKSKKADEMGANGKSTVKDNFNLARFASELNTLVK